MATIFEAAAQLDAVADQLEFTDADLHFGAQFIRSRILDRTSRGVDASGQQFEPYSAGYAKRKDKAGGRIDQVDLYGVEQHPHMLNAMLGRVNQDGFEVGFYGEEATRAEANDKGLGHLPERGFFRASEEDLTDVKQAMGARRASRIERALSLSNLSAAVED
jgi:hypothetical protein